MSIELHAFLASSCVPSQSNWQDIINKLGFNLKIDPGLTPFQDCGFSPCILNGKDSGFEIYYETAYDVLVDYPQIADKVEKRDYCISFRFGGDMDELACALIASAALAKSLGEFVYDTDNNVLFQTDDLIRQAQKVLRFI